MTTVVRVLCVVALLLASLNYGARLAGHDWPSLHDRAVWTPEIIARQEPAVRIAAPPPPEYRTPYYPVSSHTGFIFSSATVVNTVCAWGACSQEVR